MHPRRSYVICGTPRAGTGFLAGLLTSSGAAGHPQEHLWNRPTLEKQWGTATFEEFVAAMLEHGATENGVFGTKLMWGYFGDVLACMRTLPGACPAMTDAELLDLAWPNLRYVFIHRDDVVAQAVSHVRAVQDGIWYAGETRAPKPAHFDFDMIAGIADENVRHNANWCAWFDRHGIVPFLVRYEDLVQRPGSITLQLLRWLAVDVPAGVRIAERWPKQADAVNAEWVRRYHAMAGRAGSGTAGEG